jgi:hypothetical protein
MGLNTALAGSAIAASLLLTAACVTTRDRLTSAADRLEHHATVMAENARYQPPGIPYPPNYGQDALILANSASRLSDAAHEHASEQEVRQAFARVAHDYDAVREAASHAANPQAQTDLVPITAAYRDVRRSYGKPLNQAADEMRQKAAEAL